MGQSWWKTFIFSCLKGREIVGFLEHGKPCEKGSNFLCFSCMFGRLRRNNISYNFFFSFLSPLQVKVSYHQYICYIDKIEIMNLYYLLANLFVWFSIPIKQWFGSKCFFFVAYFATEDSRIQYPLMVFYFPLFFLTNLWEFNNLPHD